ncbi:hypothetical protein CEE37_10245 [candidate division LCP-89 bacterium B3_LCP]|uniref:Poly A polymerase head domain-containing protein n=1 Tax=candidate division LCP-89 bacterium B3_LCP TaxID=2012998 RepID=A0A532UZE6_UNCL8|nr:MAG: hypothetical protein CEE37_10245 [candidate division LCP-89 bacterium B3_LCP]
MDFVYSGIMDPTQIAVSHREDDSFKQAAQVVSNLQKGGWRAYFVGGCVRDLMLDLKPQDYDIATDAKPEDVKKIFPDAKGVGKRFGVSIIDTPSGKFEIAAFREDGVYYDHRRPAWVKYAGMAEDATRRDFSINALYYDPVAGETIDLVDGIQDLNNRLLRMIDDPFERLDEDWLRLLRVVRFAARYSLLIERRTWDALRTLAPMIPGLSAERCTEEMRLMLQDKNAGRAIGLLKSSGLWRAMWPDLPFARHRIRKVIRLLEKTGSKSAIWKCFFTDLPEETVVKTCENLRLTRAEKRSLGIK